MKEFNTTGICIPEKHYMVDISDRLVGIRTMIDAGKYFCISKGRQYGKTTTLALLDKEISNRYISVTLDFQDIGAAGFSDEFSFVHAFSDIFCDAYKHHADRDDVEMCEIVFETVYGSLGSKREADLRVLFRVLNEVCAKCSKQIVLMIDEVDSASDNQVFLDFLAQLRSGYLKRERDIGYTTFQSVILVGVNDIRHLRSKIRDKEQHRVNSPWNIAADFNIDMDLHKDGIRGMLDEYKIDHHADMNTDMIAGLIYDYTSGYPFLVSRICQLMDMNLSQTPDGVDEIWSQEGVNEAVKKLLSEQNALFDSLTGKLTNFPELRSSIHDILMDGLEITYNPYQEYVKQMEMYGFIRNEDNKVAIANRIFETLLYNLFISDDDMKDGVIGQESSIKKSIFIKDNELDMPLILEHFIITYIQVFGSLEDKFKEKDGRELFLLYLKPIINGTGNYYIEAQTRNQRRTDVVVDYLGHQYVIELKIWRGDRYNEKGEAQLKEYLDYFNLETGYMLSFNFNRNKKQGVKKIDVDGRIIYEAML